MSLTILSDSNVRGILTRLTPNDVSSLFSVFSEALHSYSIGQERQYQCHRQGITRPEGPTVLFMPATLSNAYSVKVVGVPAAQPKATSGGQAGQAKPIQGAIMICDEDGKAVGLINAAETTAFRTSLGSILMYQYRERTANIVVFGAGKQALWHLRLALVLRSSDIRRITVVNRSVQRAEELIERLREMDKEAGVDTTSKVALSVLEATSEQEGNETQLRRLVEEGDVIFCTTPSTQPLFPADWLTTGKGREKTRFISAIGSYKLDMQEIDPEFLRAIATSSDAPLPGLYNHSREVATDGGIIIVDSREACAVEAGEVVKAQIREENLLEIGELVNLRKGSTSQKEKDTLNTWLKSGLVVYKSVGIGIMDLSIGQALLELANVQSVGTRVDSF